MRSRRQRQQTHARQESTRQLQLQRSTEETPEPAPVRALLEAESVLDQGLFDGQVEQRLEEPRGRDHDRVQTEHMRRERVSCDHRPEEAEDDRGVDPSGCRGPAPEEPRAHQNDHSREGNT